MKDYYCYGSLLDVSESRNVSESKKTKESTTQLLQGNKRTDCHRWRAVASNSNYVNTKANYGWASCCIGVVVVFDGDLEKLRPNLISHIVQHESNEAMCLGRPESDMSAGLEVDTATPSPRNTPPRENFITYRSYSHFNESFRNLANMRKDGRLCDVVFVVSSVYDKSDEKSYGIKRIQAHRCILVSACPYFAAMFNSSMMESEKKVVFLKEIDAESLEAIIEFIYTGGVNIDDSNVQKLFIAASIFQMSSLQDACANYLRDQLDPSNCLGFAQFALSHGCSKLYAAANCFAKQHFWELINCEEFLLLSKERLCELISLDHLNTNGEEKVYEGVKHWLHHDIKNRIVWLAEVMSHVRMSLVPRQYLTTHIDADSLLRKDSSCKDYLLEAYRYHLTGKRNEDSERFRPRMPVAPTRCSSVSILGNCSYAIAAAERWKALANSIVHQGGQAPKAITDVDVLDFDSGSWISVNDLPQRRCRCGVSELNGMIYAVGGFNGSMRVRTVEVFDLGTGCWCDVRLMNERRSTLGVATSGNRIYAVGGYDGNSGLCTAEAFDPRTGEWVLLPSMSIRRSSVGVAAIGDYVYAVGGFDGICKQSLDTVEVFDIRMNLWRPAPPLNRKRSGAAVTAFGKYIIAVGGHDGPEIRGSVEVLYNGSWQQLIPDMKVARRNASALCVDSTLYVIGGEDGRKNLDTIESLDVSSLKGTQNSWQDVGVRLKQPKSYCGVCLLPKPLGAEIYSEAYQAGVKANQRIIGAYL